MSPYRDGTGAIIAATALTALAVYLFQVIVGRSLGVEGFAPLGVLWTISFMVFTVLYLPVEQYVTRRLILGGGRWSSDQRASLTVAVPLMAGVVIGGVFVLATLDRFFEGNPVFVLVIIALLATRSGSVLGRGFLGGRRRFHAYGAAIALEAIVMVSLITLVALIQPTTVAFAVVMPIAPLAVFVTRPFSTTVELPVLSDSIPAGSAGLGALVIATAASQMILASGPVVVGFIGGTAAAISVIFVTFTLFRGPVTSSYNLVARVLPDFTALAAVDDERQLDRWAVGIGMAGVAMAALFGVLGWLLGPRVIEVLYGGEFVPSQLVAGLAGAAVGLALASLFLNQIYVARGDTPRLAVIWITALLVSVLTLVLVSEEPVVRVAVAFVVGEAAAMVLLVAGSTLPRRRRISAGRRSPMTISAHLRYPAIKRALASMPDAASITEIGPGRGAMASRLVAAGYDYVGFEPDIESFHATEAALLSYGGVKLHNTLIPDDPDQRSDVVVAFEVLEHIEDDAQAVAGWFRWVRPGGLLVISVPAHQRRFGEWDVLAGHYRRYEREQLIAMFENAGFVAAEIRSVGFPAGLLLEMIRNRIADPAGSTIEERTAASGGQLQPTTRSAWLTASVAFPFYPVQRAFERTDLGTGYVAWARRPGEG